MKISLSEKIIAWLTLLSGLSISAVAVYYSVAGLVSIFAAAALPIMVMGIALEVSKLIATVWLKINWKQAPRLIKTYLMVAIAILMLITSMGIFGYLSKAHLDQAVPTGDIAAKVELIDTKIQTQKDNIASSKAALKQMDAQVNEMLSRSTDNKGTERAVQIRKQQEKERAKLQKDIETSNAAIAKLNEERAPIAKDLRKVEAEVGPIKYIAALLYGDNPDSNLLEKAVRWVIITIVLVFDPLAVILLLASQYSFQWFRERLESSDEKEETVVEVKEQPIPEDDGFKFLAEEKDLHPEEPVEVKEPEVEPIEQVKEEPKPATADSLTPLDQWNQMVAEAEAAAMVKPEDDDYDDEDTDEIKQAKAAWKDANPHTSVKLERKLFNEGKIDVLPWMVPPYLVEQTPEQEGYKIIPELEQINQERYKPNLTEVIEPEAPKSNRLSDLVRNNDLKKKDLS